VWVGDPKRYTRPLNGLTIGGRTYGAVYGATIAGPIWRDTLSAALEGEPVIPLPEPDQDYVHGITKPIPYVVGLSIKDATKVLQAADFGVTVASTLVDSELPAGTVAATSPAGSAPPGANVTLLISNGRAPRAVQPSPSQSSSPSASPSGGAPDHGPATKPCKPKPNRPC
jgi:hypothetical protein